MNQQYDLKYIPIDQFAPNSWNPQKQDEAEFNRLIEEMKENGCIVPLQVVPVDDGTYRIIGGEHRWRAGQQAEDVEDRTGRARDLETEAAHRVEQGAVISSEGRV